MSRSAAATKASVVCVCANPEHAISKPSCDSIELVTGLGVAGDAHFGAKVQHRSRAAVDPDQPNLRQVHLIHEELLHELRAQGFDAKPGVMGENVTTRGLDLLALPAGARLRFHSGAAVEITGLRNPCGQLNGLAPGWMDATLGRGADGERVRKAGVMGIVLAGGEVRAGEPIGLELPAVHEPLQPV